jgi:iron(III) transport system substrate-binding protein
MPIRRFSALLITLVAIATCGAVQAQNKVVIYSANDGNLNRFVFDGFTKETGIAVEGVEAGSGVLFKRMASEREKPLGDIIWGVSRALLQSNKALLAPYASKNKDATPADFRDPDDLWIGTNVHLLVILQNTKSLPAAEGPKACAIPE